MGEHHHYEVQVYLNDLDPNAVRIELYAEPREALNSNTASDATRTPIGGSLRWICIQCGRICDPSFI